MADLEKSSSSFLSAWKCNNSIPFHRIQAAARAVNVLDGLRIWNQQPNLPRMPLTCYLPSVTDPSSAVTNNMPFPISLDLLPRHVDLPPTQSA